MTSEQKKAWRKAISAGDGETLRKLVLELCKPVHQAPSDAPVLHESQQRGDDKA